MWFRLGRSPGSCSGFPSLHREGSCPEAGRFRFRGFPAGPLSPHNRRSQATQSPPNPSTVGMRIRAHTAVPSWRQRFEFRNELAILAKKLLRFLLMHPLLEDAQLFRVLLDIGQGHLVRTPEPLEEVNTYFSRRAPSLRGTQHDHRPTQPLRNAAGTAFLLMRSNFCDAVFHRSRHGLVHAFRIRSLNEVWRPAISAHEAFQFLVADARQQGRVIDLVAVQVKDGQYRSIANGTQELVDVPRSCQRSGFRFTVSNHSSDNQVRVIERSAAGVGKHISQFAAFVDRTGSLWRAVTADATWERKLFEELVQATFVFALFGIDLGVRSLEIPWAQNA